MKRQMVVTDWVIVVAGAFILVSLGLAHACGQVDLKSVSWLWFTAFVGLNLFQAGLTGFCLMAIILRKLGVKSQ